MAESLLSSVVHINSESAGYQQIKSKIFFAEHPARLRLKSPYSEGTAAADILCRRVYKAARKSPYDEEVA